MLYTPYNYSGHLRKPFWFKLQLQAPLLHPKGVRLQVQYKSQDCIQVLSHLFSVTLIDHDLHMVHQVYWQL